MEYKGKLYGRLGGKMYFDTGKTADDWDAIEKRVAELEAENKALRQLPVSGSLLSDVDYWKQRCLLAEKCLEETPCDPDITADQIKAWNAYHKFISWAGNDR